MDESRQPSGIQGAQCRPESDSLWYVWYVLLERRSAAGTIELGRNKHTHLVVGDAYLR